MIQKKILQLIIIFFLISGCNTVRGTSKGTSTMSEGATKIGEGAVTVGQGVVRVGQGAVTIVKGTVPILEGVVEDVSTAGKAIVKTVIAE